MNPITTAVKRPALLASCLALGLFSVFAAGCDSKKPTVNSGTTQRETELTKEVETLRTKLSAAEQELAQAKTQSAAVQAQQANNTSASQDNARAATENPPANENQNKDTRYLVVKKEFTAGQLIPLNISAPNATERRDAEYRITFKGEHSGNEYPALAVKETAYNEFREGSSYTAQDINQAKLPEPVADTTTATSPQTSTSTGRLSEDEARSLFGNPTP